MKKEKGFDFSVYDVTRASVHLCQKIVRKTTLIFHTYVNKPVLIDHLELIASQNYPSRLILETPYYSLTHVAKSHYPIFPIRLTMRYPFPSYKYIGDVGCPIYVFHGTDDSIVPYESGKMLFDKVSPDITSEMVTFENADHNNLSDYDLYWSKLKNFLK